ncbi:MAG: hypothetical protein BGO01_09820 [Armatimonadetes bacterium 55-13]|nr:MAG: hypothetical protein BGO01_09820 [Armatimonadetes bacterium 55-13]
MDEQEPNVPPVVQPDYSQVPPPQGQTPSSAPLGGMIPLGNSASLISYYCSIAGLLPCLALVCAPIAIVYARKGLKAHAENPVIGGRTHSLVGLYLGIFDALLCLFFVVLIVGAFISDASRH